VGTVPTSSPPVWGHENPHGSEYLVPGPHSPHTFPRRTRTPVGRIFSPFRSREEKSASRAWGSSHKSGDCGDQPSLFPAGRCSPVPTVVGTVWGRGDRPGDAASRHPDAVRSCRTLPRLGGGPSRRSVRSSGAPRGSGVSRGVGAVDDPSDRWWRQKPHSTRSSHSPRSATPSPTCTGNLSAR
jgi:hypothetical protein